LVYDLFTRILFHRRVQRGRKAYSKINPSPGDLMSISQQAVPHSFSEEALTRQRLVAVALGQREADLVLTGATLLNAHSLCWKTDWDIVISGQRIAWTGPSGQWSGHAHKQVSVKGLWRAPC